MNRDLRRFSRVSGMTVLVAFIGLAAGAEPCFAAAEAPRTEAKPNTREVVEVELKISTPRGEMLAQARQRLDFETDTSFALEADGHKHSVALLVSKPDKKDQSLRLTLGYQRDGKAVIESMELQSNEGKPTRVRRDGVVLLLELARRRVDTEPSSPPPRAKLDLSKVDLTDPLAGI